MTVEMNWTTGKLPLTTGGSGSRLGIGPNVANGHGQ